MPEIIVDEHSVLEPIRLIVFPLFILSLRMKGGNSKDTVAMIVLIAGAVICTFASAFFIRIPYLHTDFFAMLAIVFLSVLVTKVESIEKILALGGLIAFEIYLIHWNIFIILKHFDIIDDVYFTTIICLIISIILAIISYRISKKILSVYLGKVDEMERSFRTQNDYHS